MTVLSYTVFNSDPVINLTCKRVLDTVNFVHFVLLLELAVYWRVLYIISVNFVYFVLVLKLTLCC